MGANYPVYLPSATPYLRLRRLLARVPEGQQAGSPWPTGRDGGTLGLVSGETGYGQLRRPWARASLP